jgi:glycosyltransferase involved in cell wall biosynthesis
MLLSRGGAFNGSQRQLVYLVQGLDRHRYQPVAVLDAGGPLAEELQDAGADVHVLPMRPWRSFPRCLWRYHDAAGVLRVARHRGVALVHAAYPWKSGYMHYVARRLGVPCVLHVRGPMSPHDISKHGLHRASAVIVIAQRYADDLTAAGMPAERVCLVDDAVDFERFQPGDAQPNILRQRHEVAAPVLVGLVGRIDPFKRVLEFLELVAPLARDGPGSAALLIIGQPGPEPYTRAVRQAVDRLGLAEHVVFTGRCEDMPQVLASLDIVVTLSGGSVMFEAMACARAVLSVRVDGRHSLHTRHGENAWCVTTDRPGPAAEALARLIGDADLRRRLGLAGHAWVERHLSRHVLVTRTQEVYDRLLGG